MLRAHPLVAPVVLDAKILVVDDQPANVALLSTILTRAGYRAVSTTSDPRTVAALYQEQRHDLILLDMQMPGLDGFAVMAQLLAIETEGYLPVLAITANVRHKLRALEAGARDFISKPFEVAEVLMRVRNLLEVRLLHGQAREQARLLESLALSDPLTGLANRRLLDDRIDMAIVQARRHRGVMAVLYLDLDGFKAINDRLGHATGDLLLQCVAARLATSVRAEDTVCRIGGDEFVIALGQLADVPRAEAMAAKLITVLSQPYQLEGAELYLTASVGISTFPAYGSDAARLVSGADAAMYEAKRSGRNTWRLSAALAPGDPG